MKPNQTTNTVSFSFSSLSIPSSSEKERGKEVFCQKVKFKLRLKEKGRKCGVFEAPKMRMMTVKARKAQTKEGNNKIATATASSTTLFLNT